MAKELNEENMSGDGLPYHGQSQRRIEYAKRMIFLNQILLECEPQLEQIRVAQDYADGRGRIEKQGYTGEPDAVKKYQWKFGFAHGVAQNDPEADLANSNEPRYAIIQECQRIKDGQQSQFEAENKL